MNPWPFVAAAYVVTLGGAVVIAIVSYLAMRRAESPVSSAVEGPVARDVERPVSSTVER